MTCAPTLFSPKLLSESRLDRMQTLMSISGFAFSYFDLGVLGLIALGMYRGRTRGMSEELLDVMKWLAIVVVGGMVYRPVGTFVASYTQLPAAAAYVAAYILVIITIRTFFGWIKRAAGEKLVGSDAFGSSEYYLGMMAGTLRFVCYLIVGMALLNAKHVTPEERAALARVQQENFGDISFPTISSLQQTVFAESASGRFAKQYLAGQMIVPDMADRRAGARDTLGRQRERAISEILGERR